VGSRLPTVIARRAPPPGRAARQAAAAAGVHVATVCRWARRCPELAADLGVVARLARLRRPPAPERKPRVAWHPACPACGAAVCVRCVEGFYPAFWRCSRWPDDFQRPALLVAQPQERLVSWLRRANNRTLARRAPGVGRFGSAAPGRRPVRRGLRVVRFGTRRAASSPRAPEEGWPGTRRAASAAGQTDRRLPASKPGGASVVQVWLLDRL
jgi:hypothetical protein